MLQIEDFACFPNHNSSQYITNTLIDDMMYDVFKSDCVVNAGCKLCAKLTITELD
jgi:hypothetical protein